VSITPYIIVRDGKGALDFYVRAFGGVEDFRLVDPSDGRIGHAELLIAGGRVMLADEYPDFGALSPDSIGGSPVTLHVAVDDPDAAMAQALAAGAQELRPVKDQFFGDRSGTLIDPYGHHWTLHRTITPMTASEMQARWNEATG
jgi:PhnB protein